jgi:hypothetical protein
VDAEPDGLVFDASSVKVAEIRPQDEYGGKRVTLLCMLGPACLKPASVVVGLSHGRQGPPGSQAASKSVFPPAAARGGSRNRASSATTVLSSSGEAVIAFMRKKAFHCVG